MDPSLRLWNTTLFEKVKIPSPSSIHQLIMKLLLLLLNHVSCVCLFAAPCTIAHQVALFMEFSRQEYWSQLPFPSPGDLPDSRIESVAPALQVNSLLSESPKKSHQTHNKCLVHTSPQPLSLKKHFVILSRMKGNSWEKKDILVTYSLHFPIAGFSIPLKT